MGPHTTPGLYIEEIPVLPSSVDPVPTAVPVFIGYAGLSTAPMKTPVRITSMVEFHDRFGTAPAHPMEVTVNRVLDQDGKVQSTRIGWNGAAPELPASFLDHAVQMYFANGGGPAWIHALGDTTTRVTVDDFTDAIDALEAVDEPTLLVFPDAVKLTDAEYGAVVDRALASCARMKDRFTIVDVRDALPARTDTVASVDANFRAQVTHTSVDVLKYGAAYFPYLRTALRFVVDDAAVTIAKATDTRPTTGGGTVDEENAALSGRTLADSGLKQGDTALYGQVRALVDQATVTMPPSGAVAGLYAQTDRTRGVWKAPSNVVLAMVTAPAVAINDNMQAGLTIDVNTGKSVNAIRTFTGRGTLIWGARTLAGNDSEWRYVSVRRFANFVEESVARAMATFVFEPNDATTWVRVRAMIENFLVNQWRSGALQGMKPEHAFGVSVGLGQTMQAQDILDGLMIVEVRLAMVRPAEFIVLRLTQKMAQS